jgi:hypothetical protein
MSRRIDGSFMGRPGRRVKRPVALVGALALAILVGAAAGIVLYIALQVV